MGRSRIHDDQVVDEGFVSEREFNDFYGQVVITGTEGTDDTELTTSFDNYLPGRGIFVGSDGNVVSTGTNTINIAGFYTEFVASSGSLQSEIDGLVSGAAGVSSINTITGSVTIAPGTNVTVVDNVPAGIITISAEAPPADAIVGAGTVEVVSGTNVVIVSGTPHTENTDTISDAIVGGVGIVVTSGSNETTIDGHLRYTKDENDAIIGGDNVTVVSGVDTITISSVDTDTVSDAIIGGEGITVTSGSNETTIDGHLRYQKNENDAILGTDGNTVISGSETITIQGFRPEFVSASGSLQTQIDQNASDISDNTTLITTTSGHLQGQVDDNASDIDDLFAKTQVDEINTVTGTVTLDGADGNTVITSGQTITVSGFRGEFVSASGSLQSQIDAVEGSDVDSINGLIGDVLIVDGVNSTANTNVGANSIQIDTFDDDDVDSLTASGVTVTGSVQLETLGGISVTADAGTDTVTISGGAEVGALTGSLFQIDFTNGGNTSNTWLAVSDSNLSGNTTPWQATFPCRLAGLGFSNRNTGVDLDLEFHVARFGDGNTTTVEYTWEIRNVRTAHKTDIAITDLLLEPGDKVSVYANGAGGSGRDVWFGVFWEITSRPSSEDSENWSGNIT